MTTPERRLYDISRPLAPSSAVFPGDTAFAAHQVMRLADGDACDVSTMTMSVHTGTHVDAPSHFQGDGATIDEIPLDRFLGRARVVELTRRGEIAGADLRALDLDGVDRLLLKTGSAPDPDVFNEDFAHLSVDAAAACRDARLVLLGIDTPSMDRWDSKTLDAHRALLAGGVTILENLLLDDVPVGDYELIALPLKLRGLDASPVRAVLRTV